VNLVGVKKMVVTAGELKRGDYIRHFTEERWKVLSIPTKIRRGMLRFQVLCLDSQQEKWVIFDARWRFTREP
jgi:hypothetical protein